MYSEREPRFEALVYTRDRGLAARCARAFAEFPVDWVMLDEAERASNYLGKQRFDFIVLDLDSAENDPILLNILHFGVNPHGVVLAVTAGPVDPATLNLCYAAQIFYPVRPAHIEQELYRGIPLAERLLAEPRTARVKVPAETVPKAEPGTISVPDVVALTKGVFSNLVPQLRSAFNMRHSLSIVAQEWAASLLASIGMIWFGQEATSNFRGLQYIAPPSAGPSNIIALGVLLWLCAKHRRVAGPKVAATVEG